MTDAVRVTMPRPMASIIRPDDVQAHLPQPTPMGRRYSVDISEELLSKGAREGLAYAFDDLCKHVARAQRPMLENEARAWMSKPENREWIKSLVQDAILREVHEFMYFRMTPEGER